MKKPCTKCPINQQCSKLYTLQKCKHIFCEKCLYEHVNNEFNKLNPCKIKCPSTNCDKVLSDQDIRKFLSTYRIEQYEKLQFSQETLQKCLTKSCPYIYISRGDPIFQCEYCEQPNCTKCKIRHYPHECQKNENREEIRELSAQQAIREKKRKEIEGFDLKFDLVPNFDGFTCPICEDFFLPNTEVMLRKCQDEFCLKCLKTTLQIKKTFQQLRCPKCNELLTSVEINKLVGKKFMDSLNKSVILPKMYNCKYADCIGFWDCDSQKKSEYKCPVCGNMNCIACGVVHKKGETCSKFQNCDEFKHIKAALEEISQSNYVVCLCGKILIQKEGCGSLYCNNCGIHVCVFTGKKAGNKGENSCGCTPDVPCHVKCKYGCIDD